MCTFLSIGSEKQEIKLPLMRKGLHTPLVVLSTWNPGGCGANAAKQPQWEIRGQTRKVNWSRGETRTSVWLISSMTNESVVILLSARSRRDNWKLHDTGFLSHENTRRVLRLERGMRVSEEEIQQDRYDEVLKQLG